MSGPQAEHVEATDVRAGWVVAGGVFFAAVAVLTGFFLYWLFGREIKEEQDRRTDYSIDAFPRPRLQKDPRADLLEFRKREEEDVSAYRWKDESRNSAQIPVDRAMRIAIENGLFASTPKERSDAR